jgi:hypothetical protein
MEPIASVDLSALFTQVQSAITSNLPSILGVAAMIIGITVVVKLFKRIAK